MSADVRKQLKSFLSLTLARSSKPISWSTNSLKELTEAPIYVLKHVPSARSSALEYLGLLLIEDVHIYITQLENPASTSDFGNIEDAITDIITSINQLVSSNADSWLFVAFQWTLESLAEVSRRFNNRRPIASGTLTDSLKIYTSIRGTRSVLDLLNFCIGELLHSSPEKCVTALLELSTRFGALCDWILTYISIIYPTAIISQLINCGLVDFSTFLFEITAKLSVFSVNQLVPRVEQYDREKLVSLASILCQLADQQSLELKNCLLGLFHESLDSEANPRKQHALPFLLKLCMFSREISELLIKDIEKNLTLPKIVRSVEIFGKIPSDVLFPDKGSLGSVINVVLLINDPRLVKSTFEYLSRLSFDNSIFTTTGEGKYKIQKAALQVLDAMLNQIDAMVHGQFALSLDRFPILQLIDLNLYDFVHKMMTERSDGSKFYFKLVTLNCMIKGVERAAYVLSCILYGAQSNRQLTSFVDFCTIIGPFMTNLTESFLLKIVNTIKYIHSNAIMSSTKSKTTNWLKNLLKLIDWEQKSDVKIDTCFVNISKAISENYTAIVEQLFSICYDNFYATNSMPELIGMDSVLFLTLTILNRFDRPPNLPISQSYRIICHCVRLICDFLTLLPDLEKDNEETITCFELICSITLKFLSSQTFLIQEAFVKIFFHYLMADDKWIAIFYPHLSNLDFDELQYEQADLLGENKKQALMGCLAALLVHSGRIGNGKRGQLLSNQHLENARLKTGHLANFLRRLCTMNKSSNGTLSSTPVQDLHIYHLELCTKIAQKLNEYICPDAISAEHSTDFSDGHIERLLFVTKRVNQIPFVWDILRVISNGYPSLWFTLPLLKSVLISTMIKFESSVDKLALSNRDLLETTRKWFAVCKEGNILPKEFLFLDEVIGNVCNHEAFVILSQVWKYLQKTWPDLISLEKHYEACRTNSGKGDEIIRSDPMPFLEPVRLIMQANIGSTGHLYRKCFIVNNIN